jgi:hypothetical protein
VVFNITAYYVASVYLLQVYQRKPLQNSPEAHQWVQWVPDLFPGVKRPGRGVDHPPYLEPRLGQSTAIALLPLCAFMAGYKENLTFCLSEKCHIVFY